MTKLLASWDVKVQTVMEPHYVSIYVQFPPVHVEFVMWKQWSPARGYYTNMDQNWCMSNNWIDWIYIYITLKLWMEMKIKHKNKNGLHMITIKKDVVINLKLPYIAPVRGLQGSCTSISRYLCLLEHAWVFKSNTLGGQTIDPIHSAHI